MTHNELSHTPMSMSRNYLSNRFVVIYLLYLSKYLYYYYCISDIENIEEKKNKLKITTHTVFQRSKARETLKNKTIPCDIMQKVF